MQSMVRSACILSPQSVGSTVSLHQLMCFIGEAEGSQVDVALGAPESDDELVLRTARYCVRICFVIHANCACCPAVLVLALQIIPLALGEVQSAGCKEHSTQEGIRSLIGLHSASWPGGSLYRYSPRIEFCLRCGIDLDRLRRP